MDNDGLFQNWALYNGHSDGLDYTGCDDALYEPEQPYRDPVKARRAKKRARKERIRRAAQD